MIRLDTRKSRGGPLLLVGIAVLLAALTAYVDFAVVASVASTAPAAYTAPDVSNPADRSVIASMTEQSSEAASGERISDRRRYTYAHYRLVEEQALDGDYQAQRDIAHWLSGGFGVPPGDAILACAWRIVIVASSPAEPESNADEFEVSDAHRKERDCDESLTDEEHLAAIDEANRLLRSIAGRNTN